MLDLAAMFWCGVIGGCVGSFLNVVAYRAPLGISVVWRPSHCPQCQRPIRWYDNIPVLGWLRLRGRCRDCGCAISPRYALVEAFTAAAFAAIAWVDLRPIAGGVLAEDGRIAWPTIARCACHCLLASGAIAATLLRWDRHLSRGRFAAILIVLAALAFGAPIWIEGSR